MNRVCFLLAILCCGTASAGVIDFEDVAIAPGDVTARQDVSSGGFLFDSSTNHTHLANDVYEAYNGTTWLGLDDDRGDAVTTVTRVGGGAFSLQSLDLTEYFGTPNGTQVDITGHFVDGGTVSQRLVLDDIADGAGPLDDFERIDFDREWTNLASIAFDSVAGGGDRWFGLDNIVFDESISVPEPSGAMLFGLALAGLGVARRYRAN